MIYERKKEINYVTLSSKLAFFTKYVYVVHLWDNEVGTTLHNIREI